MGSRLELDRLLKKQTLKPGDIDLQGLFSYAENIARIENVVAVVSDLKENTSWIYPGRFGSVLGLENYDREDSIWENHILDLMTEAGREEKYLAELRFFHFLRHMPRSVRPDFYLASKLRMKNVNGEFIDILHRMYYIYAAGSDSVCHALCLYGSLTFDFAGKSLVVNSITGASEELASTKDILILSKRQRQVLKMINNGRTSTEIARLLSISRNTVSRHRQEILSKLQVRNSVEACKVAVAMGII